MKLEPIKRPTTYRVVTSYAPSAEEVYGRRFLASIAQHWPQMDVTVVTEDGHRPKMLPAYEHLKHSWVSHLNTHLRSHPQIRAGSEQNQVRYRKFGAKLLALYQAYLCHNWHGWLIWIDADVEFKNPVTPEWLASVLGGHKLAVLLRPANPNGAETGFTAYDLREKAVRHFINTMANEYLSGNVAERPDWTDGALFAAVHREHKLGRMTHDLSVGIGEWATAKGRKAARHPFPHSILGEVMEHHKGVSRKQAAYGHLDTAHPSKLPR